MKGQTITFKEKLDKVFYKGFTKMTPRKLLLKGEIMKFKEDKRKIENLSHDLQKKYGMKDFFVKPHRNKLKIISLD